MNESILYKIIAERINPNDETLRLCKWFFNYGEKVKKGDLLCSLESSKSVIDIEAPENGYLFYKYKENDEIEIGELLAILSSTPIPDEDLLRELSIDTPNVTSEIIISEKAIQLATEMGVDYKNIKNKSIITEKDIRTYFENKTSDNVSKQSLSHTQYRVAQYVSKSHQIIPASFIERKIAISETIEYLNKLKSESNLLITLLDLIIFSSSRAIRNFPIFNARLVGDTILIYNNINIGIATDIKDDLFIITLQAVDKKSLFDISSELIKSKYLLIKGKLSKENLTGSTFAITSLIGTKVTSVIPIIFPAHSCILGISDIMNEDGVSNINICISFDHRIINAGLASRFLESIINGLSSVAKS